MAAEAAGEAAGEAAAAKACYDVSVLFNTHKILTQELAREAQVILTKLEHSLKRVRELEDENQTLKTANACLSMHSMRFWPTATQKMQQRIEEFAAAGAQRGGAADAAGGAGSAVEQQQQQPQS